MLEMRIQKKRKIGSNGNMGINYDSRREILIQNDLLVNVAKFTRGKSGFG